MLKRFFHVGMLILLASSVALAVELPVAGTVEVCFTPGEDCTGEIVREINGAGREVLVQAYELTSAPIAKSLVAAARRGVRVVAVLDKSQRYGRGAKAGELIRAGIPVYIDERPAIAHSKVIIVDQADVITGSFNFTRAAQDKNAENLLILRGNGPLVEQYLRNFAGRLDVSVKY